MLTLLLQTLAAFSRAADPAPEKAAVAEAPAAGAGANRTGMLVRVPLPLAAQQAERLVASLERLVERLPAGASRPAVVFEFYEHDPQAVRETKFEPALRLARRIAQLGKVQTIAHLTTLVQGHAVLPAIACEEIYMSRDAELGAAGVGEERIAESILGGYREIVNQRKTLPWPLVLGMLDRSTRVWQVTTDAGVQFVLDADLEPLRKKQLVRGETEIIKPGQLGTFKGIELREMHLVKRIAEDRESVARELELPPGTLVEDPSLGGKWRPQLVRLHRAINAQTAERMLQKIDEHVRKQANFICIDIDSPGGSPSDSIQVANFLARLKSEDVRTVAYISRQARADAALIALACDHIVMHPDAKLGGFGAYHLKPTDLETLQPSIRTILARHKSRSWSLLEATVNSELAVHRYVRPGERGDVVDYFSAEELQKLADPDRWQQKELVTTPGRPLELDAQRGRELGLVTDLAPSIDALRQNYAIDEPLVEAQSNWAMQLIEALGDPRLSWLLLMIGFIAMYIELQTPGLGIGGFLSGVCFLLYFWSQFLHGTAEWLEILLFVAGAFCVAIEIFVMPGFGILGFGGGAMMLVSLVLASQTFVLPNLSNDYQVASFRNTLTMVVGSIAGFLAAGMFMRRYFRHVPVLGKMILEPPQGAELAELQHREAVVDLAFLVGQQGVTTTRLNPAGIARFQDELIHVTSDGDLIPRDTPIVVIEAHGSRVVVRRLEARG